MGEARAATEEFDAGRLAVFEAIATGSPLAEVLAAIARLVEGRGAGLVCSILLYDSVEGRLRHGAAPSLPDAYRDAIDGSAVGPRAGSCGTAVHLGRAVCVEDIATDPLWDGYREFALPLGLKACWSSPIRSSAHRILGTFAIYYREPRGPTEQERTWVDAATHLAAIAIERDTAERALRVSEARARQLARLHAVSSMVGEAVVRLREPAALFEAACRIAVEGGLAAMAWVGIYRDGEDAIEPLARFGAGADYADTIRLRLRDQKIRRGPAAAALLEGRPAVSNDLAGDPDFHFKDEALGRGLRSCAVLPLSLGIGVRGVLAIYGAEPHVFREEEIRVLRTMAENLSAAVESRELEGHRRFLLELGEATRDAAGPDQVLPVVIERLARHLRASRCHFAELDADGDLCRIPYEYVARGPSMIGTVRLSDFGPELAARVVEGSKPVTFRDVVAELPASASDRLVQAGIRAFVCCALRRQGVVKVLMAVHQDAARDWTAGEIDLVQQVVERAFATIEQRSAETRLERSRALVRMAGQVARLGGWTLEASERRVTWSEELCALVGIEAGKIHDLEGMVAAFAPEAQATVREALEACLGEARPFELDVELAIGAARRGVLLVGQPERGPSGAVATIQGALQDVDERRRLEGQLRQAQKMEAVGRLAAGVAHDFNNLLSVILGYAAFLVDELKPGDPIRADLQEIAAAGQRAGELTRQLLTFSRHQVVRARVVDLGQLLGGLERMLRRLIPESIQLTVSVEEGCGRVRVDPGQLEQVVVNLAVNARDAMPTGGSLTIEVADAELDEDYASGHHGVMAGRYVLLAVTDTGMGMDEATRARIFEPFFTTKEKGRGTGLGLSTVYGIVKQAGGHVWVYSEAGVGTTFKVYLPWVDAAPDRTVERPRPKDLRGNETILVTEDTEQVRAVCRAILRRAGYNVLEAQNAGEALLIGEQFPGRIHLLVTDVVLPRIGGRELASRLIRTRPDLRVLFMSGYAEEAVARHGVLDSDHAFLSKPLTPETLLTKVRGLLDEGRAGAEPPRPPREDAAPQGPHNRILLVDDEESIVSLGRRVLARMGYEVDAFTDPAAALEACRRDPDCYAVAVSDVSMPGMNGFEFVGALRALKPGLPAIFMSGYFGRRETEAAERVGAGALILKPVVFDELAQALRRILAPPP